VDGLAVASQTTAADGLYLFPNRAPGTGDDVIVSSTTTGAVGAYIFNGLGAGDYFVQFDLPVNYIHSPSDQGSTTRSTATPM
jgi:hypothetical protein